MGNDSMVAKLLSAAAEQMRIDFEKLADLHHPAEKGRGREDVVRHFLREYMPARFGVDTGFVIDATGSVSKQMDVVMFDQMSAPVFRMSESVRLFLAESVAGVLQVKSFLSTTDLDDAVQNLTSASVLDRTAGGQGFTMAGGVMQPGLVVPEGEPGLGDTLDAEGYLVNSEPILTSIFAFRGAQLPKLAARLCESSQDPISRVPLLCVLDQGIVSYVKGAEFAPYNAYWSDAKMAFTAETDKGRTLQLFYALLAYGLSRKVPIAPSYSTYAASGPLALHFVQ